MGHILYHPDPLPGERSFPPGEGIGRSKPPTQAQYVMGHDDRERRRLALQASILNPLTEQLHLMLEAGFRAPDCPAEYPIMDGGPDSPFYEWIAESFRSIAQRAAAGFIKESELDIDVLDQQLRQELASRDASIPGPTMVGCFARKP